MVIFLESQETGNLVARSLKKQIVVNNMYTDEENKML